MLSEIDKDARDIAALQQEVRELREQCVTNLRCIVALEEETRLLKAQQTKDYTQLMSLGTRQTETLSRQETTLSTLQKDVRGVQEQTLRLTVLDKDTRARLERMVLPAFEPVVINAVTGEKVRLPPLEGCPNVFVLQAESVVIDGYFFDYPEWKNKFYSERPFWKISITHEQETLIKHFTEEQGIEDRTSVKTFLFEHIDRKPCGEWKPLEWKPCVSKQLVPPFSVFRKQHDSVTLSYGRGISFIFNTYQPTLIEFVL